MDEDSVWLFSFFLGLWLYIVQLASIGQRKYYQ